VTRRSLPVLLALLAAAPLRAQVGYLPDASPFEDLRGRQALTFATGILATAGDPAGVAPRSGMFVSARYEALLAGPLWVQGRFTYAPRLERTFKDPLFTGSENYDGTSKRPFVITDIGFLLNLTGNKSWHGLVPQFHSAVGSVSGGTNRFDVGGYRFGTKFTVNYGLGLRRPTGSEWEWHADLTHQFWKYKYPESYSDDSFGNPNPILPTAVGEVWRGNLQLSFGVSRFFFR
jgi:hypothetical protein